MKIHYKYINEAKRIRINYLNLVKNFTEKEELIKKYKDRILEILDYIEKYIDKNKKLDEESLKETLNEELMDINSNMDKIQNDVKKLDSNIQNLKNQSKKLYITIEEKYPELNEKEIQKQILYSLDN